MPKKKPALKIPGKVFGLLNIEKKLCIANIKKMAAKYTGCNVCKSVNPPITRIKMVAGSLVRARIREYLSLTCSIINAMKITISKAMRT